MITDSAGLTQLIVFRLAGREYALPVRSVAEVLRMVALTPVPEAPAWLAGMLNLRGRIIPVVDLRTRLGLPAQAIDVNTPIIVAQTTDRVLGLIADEMTEVVGLPLDAIQPPDLLAGAGHAVTAMARAGGRLLLILDLTRVVTQVDLALADPTSPTI